jgi:hypothetical protein
VICIVHSQTVAYTIVSLKHTLVYLISSLIIVLVQERGMIGCAWAGRNSRQSGNVDSIAFFIVMKIR